jgi:hypothetical protein
MLRVRLITDICEPLLLFVLGSQSSPSHLFQSTAQEGLHKEDYAQPWIMKRQEGELVVVGKDKADAMELDSQGRSSLRMRTTKGWRSTRGASG